MAVYLVFAVQLFLGYWLLWRLVRPFFATSNQAESQPKKAGSKNRSEPNGPPSKEGDEELLARMRTQEFARGDHDSHGSHHDHDRDDRH